MTLLVLEASLCSKEACFPHLAPGSQPHIARLQQLALKGGANTGSNLQLTHDLDIGFGSALPAGLCLIIANLLTFFLSTGYLKFNKESGRRSKTYPSLPMSVQKQLIISKPTLKSGAQGS